MAADLFDAYFPFDAGPGAVVSEAQWTEMVRHITQTGVVGGVGGDLAVTVVAGMTVRVAAGAVFVEGHYARNSAVTDFVLAAAHATFGRIDRVVARLDWTANTVALDVLTGAAGASPVIPALTQSATVWEIAIARITVAATTVNISGGAIVDERLVVADNTAPPTPLVIMTLLDSYVPIASDRGKVLFVSAATTKTVTIMNDATMVLAVGESFTVIQGGAGQVQFVAGAGVTINAAASAPVKTRATYSVASILKTSPNVWLAGGDLAA